MVYSISEHPVSGRSKESHARKNVIGVTIIRLLVSRSEYNVGRRRRGMRHGRMVSPSPSPFFTLQSSKQLTWVLLRGNAQTTRKLEHEFDVTPPENKLHSNSDDEEAIDKKGEIVDSMRESTILSKFRKYYKDLWETATATLSKDAWKLPEMSSTASRSCSPVRTNPSEKCGSLISRGRFSNAYQYRPVLLYQKGKAHSAILIIQKMTHRRVSRCTANDSIHERWESLSLQTILSLVNLWTIYCISR